MINITLVFGNNIVQWTIHSSCGLQEAKIRGVACRLNGHIYKAWWDAYLMTGSGHKLALTRTMAGFEPCCGKIMGFPM